MAIITGKGVLEGRGTFAKDPAFKAFRGFNTVENGITVLWQDVSGTEIPVQAFNDPVGAIRDYRTGLLLATQSNDLARPSWRGSGNGIRFDRSNDALIFSFTKQFDGYLVVATKTASYVLRVRIPIGSYSYGRWELFDVLALEFYESFWGDETANLFLSKLVERGATPTSGFSNVTSLVSAWQDRAEIVSFPLINTTNVTNMTNTWNGCLNMESFPSLNTSNVTNFNGTWQNCQKLKPLPFFDASKATTLLNAFRDCRAIQSFPFINTPDVTSVSFAWSNCIELIDFPQIDTSKVTNFQSAWSNCNKLTSFPSINTSSGNNFTNAWFNCLGLTQFPMIQVSNATSLNSTWFECRGLTSFPKLVTSSITNFNSTWRNCINLTSFPDIDTSNATVLIDTWRSCVSLTSFPEIDTSKVTNMSGAWRNCNGLVSFPDIDTSNVTNLDLTWENCRALLEFPEIDTSNVTSMRGTWFECTGLTEFPSIDTSKVTSFNFGGTGAWRNCNNLLSFPFIVTSSVTDFGHAWRSCSKLTEFPEIDTSAATSLSNAWFNCLALTSFPELNTANVTDFSFAWSFCRGLTSFPSINTSNAINISNAWENCSALTSFPSLNISSATNASRAWAGCTSLTSFPVLNFSSIQVSAPNVTAQGLESAWNGCTNLVSFPANVFNNCNCVNFTNAFRNCALSEQSVDNILVSLVAAGKSNGRLDIVLGNSAPPSQTGLNAKATLESRGWVLNVPVSLLLPDSDDVPFEEEAISFLDVFKLYYDGFQFGDPIEVWENSLGDGAGNATQMTLASQPTFLLNANASQVPGVLFDGLTTQHYELGDAWKVPKEGPWTIYIALRRNNSVSRVITSWSNTSSSNISYAAGHVSTTRTNYNINGIFSGNQPTHTLTDNFYSHVTNQRRTLAITKRENNGYTVHIDNLLLYQINTDGTIITPTVAPLLGARWNAAGTEKESFLHSTVIGALLYETAHDNVKRDQVFDFLFDRYAITPPHVENRNTSILDVLGINVRGNWINADATTTMIDLSDYGKNGTYTNGVLLGQPPLAKSGESASFTAASNHYVANIGSIGDYSFMRSTNIWSFGVWIRPVSGLSDYQVLFSTTTSESAVGVIIGIDKIGTNRQLRVDLTGPAGEQQLNIRSQNTIFTNNLVGLLTVVSNSNVMIFYLNGQFWGQVTLTAGTSSSDHSQALSLAGPPVGAATGYYNGRLQLAFVSNRALTQPEIIDIYASTRLEFGE
jgi:hypothetical protein